MEAKKFCQELQLLLRAVGVSDADMEKGQMRCEANISLMPANLERTLENFGTKVEVKNLNSFKAVERAIAYEIKRQGDLMKSDEKVIQETRGWDDGKQNTFSQRVKEEAHDYRYFPEPDIPPMRFTNVFVEGIRKQIPELPDAKKSRFMKTYNMNESVADILIQEKELGEYFEKTVHLSQMPPVIIANALVNQSMDIQNIKPEEFINVINKKQQEKQVDTGVVETAIEAVIASNAKAIEDYKKGKVSALMFLIGMVKRELKGKGDATTIEIELKKRLA